jgi:hypothetical protein
MRRLRHWFTILSFRNNELHDLELRKFVLYCHPCRRDFARPAHQPCFRHDCHCKCNR